MKKIMFVVIALAVAAFAAPKSASAYYSDAAFQYIENRLPSAEITCNEGLQYYPNDQKLQMLLDRIKEAKDEQKNENKKNDKNQDNNQDQNKDQNQDQNQDQDKDQNQDQQNQDQNGEGNSSGSESSSSGGDQDQNQNGEGQNGESSSSQGGEQPEPQPEQPEEGSSDSQGEEPQEQPVQMGEMTPEEAAQLLKDFDEQNGERQSLGLSRFVVGVLAHDDRADLFRRGQFEGAEHAAGGREYRADLAALFQAEKGITIEQTI